MDPLSQIKEDWDDLAVMNAAWFIAPSPTVSNRQWKLEEFFRTGETSLAHDFGLLDRAGVAPPIGAALDFGCGLGRMTQPLSDRFAPCHGVDISSAMIAQAEAHNTRGDRCRFVVNSTDDLEVFATGTFAFVYSNNVLQHVQPATMERYLLELIRVLMTSGVLLLQIPTETRSVDAGAKRLDALPRTHPRRVWNKIRTVIAGSEPSVWYYRLKWLGLRRPTLYRLGLRPHINMYCLPEARLAQLARARGCRIVPLTSYVHEQLVHAKFAIVKGE